MTTTDDSYLFDGGDAPVVTDKKPDTYKFKASDFHNIVMRGEKPFWQYVAERANEILEKKA